MNNTKLNKLSPEKRCRIINAALEEFALYGERKASSNRIVQKAGIGKGMLFYYFTNMEGLAQFLLVHTSAQMTLWMAQAQEASTNLIERWDFLLECLAEHHAKMPGFGCYLASLLAKNGTNAALLARHPEYRKQMADGLDQLYDGIDTNCFSPDAEVDLGIQFIRHIMRSTALEQMDWLAANGCREADFTLANDQMRKALRYLARLHCQSHALPQGQA